ncbi:hypothetical protein SAY86_017441 [Trapa natans]|uniref:Uncharacterized protein n=1 Tax=Trapa natans TaxID=22666 RepID=A0AAN7LQE8_TRANT|nr:hypothetical protein SAY86_017441 [Trapa natans]
MDVKLEEMGINDEIESLARKESEDHGCAELGLRERVEWMEKKCMQLEYEIKRLNDNFKTLQIKNIAVEPEKQEIEAEIFDLRRKNAELNERIGELELGQDNICGMNDKSNVANCFDLTEAEDDTAFQLMIENKALECEKQKAERDAELWKEKFKELVSWVSHRDEKVLEELLGSPDTLRPSLRLEIMDLRKKLCGRTEFNISKGLRKQLVFEFEDGPTRKMAPPTPGVAKPILGGIIDIDDSDTDEEGLPSNAQVQNHVISKNYNSAKDVSCVSTPKRKRSSRIISSDSDSDDDVPISRLKKIHVGELSGNGVVSNMTKNSRMISTAADVDEDDDPESEDIKSDSEGESLDGFIVSDGEDASAEPEDFSGRGSEDICHGDLEDVSDSEADFEKVISMVCRKRDCKYLEWKFEGDMLAAFGKDPELCMKAVCALYRQQTADERASKGTFYANRRGFSKFDALRGSMLGDFLTGGDPEGDLKKSVKELQEHDPKAVEFCRTLASHYSKQLFDIYQNKEDPFFLPH